MPKIDPDTAPRSVGSRYPAPHDAPCRERETVRLGTAAGLTQFGVNLTILKPGAWASQRHWHSHEDEFVYVMSGELVLVEDEGETILRAGDYAAWRAGVPNGHHLVNRSDAEARFLVVGTRSEEDASTYPDIDMKGSPGRYSAGGRGFLHRDGTPY